MNTAGNQKSASTSANSNQQATQQAETKKEKSKEGSKSSDSAVKSGGRVRIRLGTNKQNCKNSSDEQAHKSDESNSKQNTKSKETTQEQKDSSLREDIAANSSHLRRITRRSNRSVQAISNEDEESISSMTSVDEIPSTTEKTISDTNNSVQETTSTSTTTTTATTTTTSNLSAANNAASSDTPRRKRRKGEVSESQTNDLDIFGLQNYKIPNQNSFELFKNIRQQVDKRLRGLSKVNPRAPHGFREYMLNRGSYLLEGNKLGNGMNLSTNEDGGMHLMMPMGKYHALKHHRINYWVPNRAKVPPSIPLNSPLYGLFVEQEKERYKMRIQHIKEREKLTLAAEQEIVRVYNQAALAAANQYEPFSVCTMLKHQEVYNYLDADGALIQTAEDAQQDQQSSAKPDGVRTRRRQHGHISPTPARKTTADSESDNNKDTKESIKAQESKTSPKSETKPGDKEAKSDDQDTDVKIEIRDDSKEGEKDSPASDSKDHNKTSEPEKKGEDSKEVGSEKVDENKQIKNEPVDSVESKSIDSSTIVGTKDGSSDDKSKVVSKDATKDGNETSDDNKNIGNKESVTQMECDTKDQNQEESSSKIQETTTTEMMVEASISTPTSSSNDDEISEEDKRAQDRDMFLNQLQQIDDKWERIRREMLIRHRNEAESLHAVQKLEWEWKTKEIGDCDVRTTPVIDNTLVPKLNIISQDY